METLIIIIFILGYLAITLEHNLKLDKLIPALGMMAILWAIVAFGIDNFTNWFDEFLDILIGKSGGGFLGNLGAKIHASPALISHIQKYFSTKTSKILSKNVYIVDNEHVKVLERVDDTSFKGSPTRFYDPTIGDYWNSTVEENKITTKEKAKFEPVNGPTSTTFDKPKEDADKLIAEAKKLGIEIAMDYALQCAPNHPYVKQHPQWFKWRPDGSVQYAENPPKKYQDILPINFETEDWKNLWDELKSIIDYWVEQGITIFRVDNPHTKAFPFWEWMINEVKKSNPDILFLAEAFTRPSVMHNLAKLGFSQSYSYFTWRNTKAELSEYMSEITTQKGKDYFRPNFWPNTPDINPYNLQSGNENMFLIRFFLAATLSSNYGLYGPVFEQIVHEAIPGKEEYLNSEKYELKQWDFSKTNKLKELIKIINKLRKENTALQNTFNFQELKIENDNLFCYIKYDEENTDVLSGISISL